MQYKVILTEREYEKVSKILGEATEEQINDAVEELINLAAFSEDELILVLKSFGNTMETLDKICQCRYGMDCLQYIESLNESTKINESKDYKKMTRAQIVHKAMKNDGKEIKSYEEFNQLNKISYLHSIAFAMDINGNLSAKLFVDDEGNYYYCINKGELVKFPY